MLLFINNPVQLLVVLLVLLFFFIGLVALVMLWVKSKKPHRPSEPARALAIAVDFTPEQRTKLQSAAAARGTSEQTVLSDLVDGLPTPPVSGGR